MSHSRKPRILFFAFLIAIAFLLVNNNLGLDRFEAGDPPVFSPLSELPASGELPPIVFDADGNTLRLTEEERQRVEVLHTRVASFNRSGAQLVCPDRYLFVNSQGTSRHHNQLQMLMNSIMWAERLNRTVVLGWFFVNELSFRVDVLYNFSEIARHYCVVSPETMRERLAHTGPLRRSTVGCYDKADCLVVDAVRSVSRGMTIMNSDVILSDGCNYVRGDLHVRAFFQSRIDPTLLVVSWCMTFLMRRGLADHAAIYALLRPSALVGEKVERFISNSFAPPARFFAVHKRHREMRCMQEMGRKIPLLRKAFGVILDEKRQRVLRAQCNISIPYLEALHASLGLRLFSFPLFLAHDGQDPFTAELLATRGAHMYSERHYKQFEDCAGGLCSLTVDYFVMVRGEYFAGNSVSSVSQNVCFARLGKGGFCHGTEPHLIRMSSYDAIRPYPLFV